MTSVTATLEALAALDPAMRVKVAAFIAARAVGIAPAGDDAVAEAAIAVGLSARPPRGRVVARWHEGSRGARDVQPRGWPDPRVRAGRTRRATCD